MSTRRPPPTIDGMHSLKVDNISYNTTQSDLRRLFDKYGDIGDIHIPRDKYNRQSRGFAFVRFYSRRDAEYAQERTDGKFMDGRELRVSVARYERVIDDRSRRSRSPRRRSRSRSPRYSRSRSPRRSRSRSAGKDRKEDKSPSRSVSPAKSRSASPAARKSGSRTPSPDDRDGSRSRSASQD